MSESSSAPCVKPGCCIEIKLLSRSGTSERLVFDLVPDEHADYPAGFLGVSTPLAQAILGEKVGITVPYFTDDLMAVEILLIKESTRSPDTDAAARRSAVVKKAKDEIEFTNAVLFAASVNTKWGSYDPDGLNYEDWNTGQSEDPAQKKDEG